MTPIGGKLANSVIEAPLNIPESYSSTWYSIQREGRTFNVLMEYFDSQFVVTFLWSNVQYIVGSVAVFGALTFNIYLFIV